MDTEVTTSARCHICGSDERGFTRYEGKQVVSACSFRPDLACAACGHIGCFIHDDISESEVWQVCSHCAELRRIG